MKHTTIELIYSPEEADTLPLRSRLLVVRHCDWGSNAFVVTNVGTTEEDGRMVRPSDIRVGDLVWIASHCDRMTIEEGYPDARFLVAACNVIAHKKALPCHVEFVGHGATQEEAKADAQAQADAARTTDDRGMPVVCESKAD
jgi:hypothetical protein